MPTTIYDLFCDESGIDAGPRFHFGALRCSPARTRVLTASLAEVREHYGLTAEMKWVRISRAMLPAYKAFVGVFLDCPYSRFRLHTVERGPQWRGFGRNEEQRFFKSYYVFLRLTMLLGCRYNIYADEKPGKRYRWSNVEFAINYAVRRDYGLAQRQVRSLSPVDSKQCDLLQVADVVLGALTSAATSPHKQELARYVRERLQAGIRNKLVCREWSPQLRGAERGHH